jgi:hypothetical protein
MTLSPAQHQREYGHDHGRLRKQLTPLVAAGQFSCAKCGKQIEPGEEWDLGHSPEGGAELQSTGSATATPLGCVSAGETSWGSFCPGHCFVQEGSFRRTGSTGRGSGELDA